MGASVAAPDVTVAVADTGVDPGHPDLAGRIVPGYDFVDDDTDPQDGHGHGTHVAGTIAAAENGAGVIGVAPEALVMPLRVLDDNGGGNSADVAAAFAYAGDRGVRVVNASLGSPYPSLVERRAIHEHPGTLYVVAAGNGGPDGVGDDNDGATREYPCAHDEPNLICVGATDSDDARAAVLQLRRRERRPVRPRPGHRLELGARAPDRARPVLRRRRRLRDHAGHVDGLAARRRARPRSPPPCSPAGAAASSRPR